MKKILALATVVMMLLISVVPAFALDPVISPTGVPEYKVDVVPSQGGTGDYEFTTTIQEDGTQNVHIWPKPVPGYKFDHWEIEGEYFTNGTPTSPELDITITSDIVIHPVYSIDPSNPPTDPTQQGDTTAPVYPTKPGTSTAPATVKPDVNPVSPQTGSNDFFAYTVILLCVPACAFAVLKLVKSK